MCQFCRKTLNTALYANSLIGVGVASSLYHTSRGEIRKYMRWADYTMIATTTLVRYDYRIMANYNSCSLYRCIFSKKNCELYITRLDLFILLNN
jgi:predicted membrane channel-forming protein YqfA (hemolysin III family)